MGIGVVGIQTSQKWEPSAAEDEWVSVTDFGAVGDGITDDTADIQTALNSGAKAILFPQGTYNITAQLKVKSNTTLFGYGATLFRAAAIDNLVINDSNGTTGLYGASSNISVYGLAFNGNSATFATNSTLLVFGHAANIYVKDCEFYNIPGTWHGLELNAVENSIVDGCVFHDGAASLEMLQLDLAANVGVFPWFGPYDLTPCKFNLVTNCLFYNGGGGVGSHTSNAAVVHDNITWTNNTFRNLSGIAIRPLYYKNVVISGNTVDGALTGVYGNNIVSPLIENWKVTDNQINNLTGAGAFGRGIYVQSIKNLVITGNNIGVTQEDGILISSCSNFVISGNTLENVSTSATTDFAGIGATSSNTGVISNNIALKNPAGLVTGTNTIRITTGGANVTVENNTVTTPGAISTFANFAGTSIIVGTNAINGTITPAASTKTTNYTYLPTDSVLNVDTTTGNLTITINPAIFNKHGLIVKKTTADANTVTITPSSGTINGLASVILTTQNETANIKTDWVNLTAIITI